MPNDLEAAGDVVERLGHIGADPAQGGALPAVPRGPAVGDVGVGEGGRP